MVGGYKLRALGRQASQTSRGAEYFWVLSMELASCRPSGSQNFEVQSRCVEKKPD